MAYDKVVDSSVLNAGLKTIADAIREKAGTSDSLAFPTAMAEAIAAIEAGGGGGLFAHGSFTPSTDTKDYVVTHDMGVVPKLVVYWASSNHTKASAVYVSVSRNKNKDFSSKSITIYYNGSSPRVLVPAYHNIEMTSSSGISQAYGCAIKGTNTTFELCDSGDESGVLLGSGLTYYWVAIGG